MREIRRTGMGRTDPHDVPENTLTTAVDKEE
jgi:hypothetical protein